MSDVLQPYIDEETLHVVRGDYGMTIEEALEAGLLLPSDVTPTLLSLEAQKNKEMMEYTFPAEMDMCGCCPWEDHHEH